MRPGARYLAGTALVAVVLSIGSGAPALADEELDQVLAAIEDAAFSGSQIVITTWGGVTRMSVVRIDRSRDVTTVQRGGGVAMIGQGRAVRSDARTGAAVSVWHDVDSDRYTVTASRKSRRLGRAVDIVEVTEGSLMRARLTLDGETGAPLVTEIFSGDGSLFRYSAMFEFEPWSTGGGNQPLDPVFDVSTPARETYHVDEAAGYTRADTYTAPDGTLQSYFSDGLFSFSLFEFEGDAAMADGRKLDEFVVRGATYERRVTASEVWVTWRSGGNTYVLVGDLPPDHLEEVLSELPRPRGRGFLSRLWSGLFG